LKVVAPTGIEPVLSALKGPRVNQLHHGAKASMKLKSLVALPGLEPGLSALRGRRVNQLHHNAKMNVLQEDVPSSALTEYTPRGRNRQGVLLNGLVFENGPTLGFARGHFPSA
jgi:hypothetical protein